MLVKYKRKIKKKSSPISLGYKKYGGGRGGGGGGGGNKPNSYLKYLCFLSFLQTGKENSEMKM